MTWESAGRNRTASDVFNRQSLICNLQFAHQGAAGDPDGNRLPESATGPQLAGLRSLPVLARPADYSFGLALSSSFLI